MKAGIWRWETPDKRAFRDARVDSSNGSIGIPAQAGKPDRSKMDTGMID
jgi:hypothetical protein